MYEFCIGLFLGYMGSLIVRDRSVRSVGVQVSEVWTPPTIPIQIKRKFVPGQLKNFWGKDSPDLS
jgi:hypothetical protein